MSVDQINLLGDMHIHTLMSSPLALLIYLFNMYLLKVWKYNIEKESCEKTHFLLSWFNKNQASSFPPLPPFKEAQIERSATDLRSLFSHPFSLCVLPWARNTNFKLPLKALGVWVIWTVGVWVVTAPEWVSVCATAVSQVRRCTGKAS